MGLKARTGRKFGANRRSIVRSTKVRESYPQEQDVITRTEDAMRIALVLLRASGRTGKKREREEFVRQQKVCKNHVPARPYACAAVCVRGYVCA
eukprot:2249854-Pleurochrysis_carterae.AAC.1